MNRFFGVVTALAGVALLLVSMGSKAEEGIDMEDMYTLYEIAGENFTETPIEGDRAYYHDVTKPFTGDCRTFSLSLLASAAGGLVFYTESDHDEFADTIYINHGYTWGCHGIVYKLQDYPEVILPKLGYIKWGLVE